ncbi:MAG TPA: DNA repair protein RecO [Patescibacteria group bacterium]|nr:DNA repair protein RecO [Patescibacteria group bacterium]
MYYIHDRAFVLRRVNFGDSDRYITLFSQNNGKIEVVARGVRKINSKRASAIELLNLIDFQVVRGPKNFVLTEVKLVDSFGHLKTELENIKKVFLMCELVDAVLANGVAHRDVFDLFERAAAKMLEGERNMAYFQAKLLSILGFWDSSQSFKNEDHVSSFIEQIIERKLRTNLAFAKAI